MGLGAEAKPIVNGKDFNIFKKVAVTATDFTSVPQVTINMRGQDGLLMILESGDPVEYSFNGNTVHGDMTANTPTEKLQFDHRRISHVWFRTTGTSSNIWVNAWAAK